MTELKDIINSMVDRLKTFAVEVERVSLEVGTQGKLGGQAVVEGVEGTWKELTNVVNKLAANLTNQVRSIAKVTKVSRLLLLSRAVAQLMVGRCERRFERDDRRRSQWRNSRTQNYSQRNGELKSRPYAHNIGDVATYTRRRSQSCLARGRFARETRGSGAGARRRGCLEGSYRQCGHMTTYVVGTADHQGESYV